MDSTSGVLNANFPFDHRHTGAFSAGVHRENRPGDGYGAIRSAHIQVAGMTLCGLHDDAALIEMNCGVATIRADGQFSTLIHFHFGAIEETDPGAGIGGGTNEFALADFVTGLE